MSAGAYTNTRREAVAKAAREARHSRDSLRQSLKARRLQAMRQRVIAEAKCFGDCVRCHEGCGR